MKRFLSNYIERHQHPVNQLLHLIGVPVTFGLSVHYLINQQSAEALYAFVGGYVLQFVGHAIEGNDAGELILIKKMLGKPYQEFGCRHPSRKGKSETADTPGAGNSFQRSTTLPLKNDCIGLVLPCFELSLSCLPKLIYPNITIHVCIHTSTNEKLKSRKLKVHDALTKLSSTRLSYGNRLLHGL